MNVRIGNPASNVFQTCCSWWLHPILRKKDSLLFADTIMFRFDWFFTKRELRIIDNDLRYALLQKLFNGYVFTARSSQLDLMFTRLGNDFNLQMRAPRTRGGWKNPPFGEITRTKPLETWGSDDDWNRVIHMCDEQWDRLVEEARI